MAPSPFWFKFTRDQYSNVPLVKADLTGKRIIVTGGNVGLGYEAATHLATMGPEKIVIACRNQTKGDEAVKKIKEATRFRNIESWSLDLADFASIKAFVDRYHREGGGLDVLLENAGITTNDYKQTKDGWESTIQVNYLGTALLGILLLPILAQASPTSSSPRWTIVTSETHHFLKALDVAKHDKILTTLNDKEYSTKKVMGERYFVSKMLEIFFVRAAGAKLKSGPGSKVAIDMVTPGFCYSEILRDVTSSSIGARIGIAIFRLLFARSTEQGGRTLVHAAIGGAQEEVQGRYLNMCKVEEESDYVAVSEEGKEVQARVWAETIDILKTIDTRVEDIVREYLN